MKTAIYTHDYRYTLGQIAGHAEALGFDTCPASEVSLTRAVKLLQRLGQTRNAFSVPEIDQPGSAEHIIFIYHRKEDRLVAAYAVFEGGYIKGCTLNGGNHDLSMSEVVMGLHRMRDFEHYEVINFYLDQQA
jgi:hypothetical protein